MRKKVIEIKKIPHGLVKLPPSKSYLHRALIMANLGGGQGLLENTEPFSHDTGATAEAMSLLKQDGLIETNVRESGSTLRFILPIYLALGRTARIRAEGRLLDRPQEIYYEALKKAGGEIRREGDSLIISGRLRPGEFVIPGDISSQYISGLLMALPLLEGDSSIRLIGQLESAPYVDMTLDLMEHFGVEVGLGQGEYFIKANQSYRPEKYLVEGDYSAGANFLVAGALGCQVECAGLKEDSLQGDRKILEFLQEAGAVIEIKENGNIIVKPGDLRAIEADVSQCPDLAPPLCVLLSFCKGESRIVGGRRLAMKESNRLESISQALNALGGQVEIDGDNLNIKGQEFFKGGQASPAGDHRIAMAIALASIKTKGKVFLENPDCVDKSYPNFFKDFCKIERKLNHE